MRDIEGNDIVIRAEIRAVSVAAGHTEQPAREKCTAISTFGALRANWSAAGFGEEFARHNLALFHVSPPLSRSRASFSLRLIPHVASSKPTRLRRGRGLPGKGKPERNR